MQIYPIDSKNNLFYVSNLFPENFLESIKLLDLDSYPYTKIHLQETNPRKRLELNNGDILFNMCTYIKENIETISSLIGTNLELIDTAFWYDSTGYKIDTHEDNSGVKIAMQIYLNVTDKNLGTTFFYRNDPDFKRYTFDFIPNTGYIMINDKNQWHGMTKAVPQGMYRLSTYTYFQYEINK